VSTSENQETPDGISVLIADDEADLLYVLREALDVPPFEVTTTQDGETALRLLQERHFDVVITDLLMPGADGLEVLRQASSLPHEVLVVIITGHASVETAIEAIRHGAYDYIRKPFRIEELEMVMANAAERIRLLRENRRLAERLEAACQQLAVRQEDVPGLRVYTSPEAALRGFRPPTGQSLLESLERVARLKNEHLLSQEEFEHCKRSLLRRL
jgi:DNA-binding NtrC family response regulator